MIYWGHRPRKRKTMQRSKCIRYKREKDTKKKKRRRKKKTKEKITVLKKLLLKCLVSSSKEPLHGPRKKFLRPSFLKDFACAYSVDPTK